MIYIYISIPFKRGEKVAMNIFMPKPKAFYIWGHLLRVGPQK